MTKRKTSTAKSIRQNLSTFDLFPFDVQFKEDGQDNFSTNFGLVLSVLILLLTGFYANVKVQAFIDKDETTYQTSEHIGALGDDKLAFDFDETQFSIQAVGIKFEGEIIDPVTNQTYTSIDVNQMVDLVMATMEFDNPAELDILSKFSVCTEAKLSRLLEKLDYTDDAYFRATCQYRGQCLCSDRPEMTKLFRETIFEE